MATGSLAPVLHYLRKVTTPVAAGDVSDAELLARFSRHRDEAAFTTLVRRHGPMVLAVCRRIVHDGHTAEDAFQATFLVLARKAGSLARPELLGHFLHGVAYRTAAKAKTEAAKRRAREQQVVRPQEVDPDDELMRQDLRAVLDEEVNRLPERYRVPVVLCYLQGHTNAEAARRLGCSRGTIATLLARARAKLRRRLTQRGVSLSAGIALAALTQTVRASVVSFPLEHVTVKAAMLLAAGQTQAAGALVAQAVALAKGVSKGMLIEKLKIPAALLMMTALVGTGAGVTAYRVRAQGAASTAPAEKESKPRPLAKSERPRKHVTVPAEPPKDEKAKFRTENFVVTAPTMEIARRVGEAAEHNRKALARLWLSKELPAWDKPCPVRVSVTDRNDYNTTTFAFQDGKVLSRDMRLEGTLDCIFADLLPHEVTHTVLAEGRSRPMPRWADEGAAILSESAASRAQHERMMANILDTGRLLPLRDLLPALDFPKDVMAFYVQSLSLTDFLVTAGGRKKFLAFVAQGEDDGWDKAARSVYGYKTIEELEQTWLRFARMRLADKRSDEPSREHRETQTPEKRLVKPFSKEKLPDGLAPIQALVKLDEDGHLLVCRRTCFLQAVTKYVMTKDGQSRTFYQPVTSYQEKHYDRTEVYNTDEIRVYDSEGQAVSLKELRKRLKGETLALVSANDHPVDPLHLRLYKKDTLVFVLPLRAVPPPTGPTGAANAPPAVGTAPPPVPLAPPSVSPAPSVDDPEASAPSHLTPERVHGGLEP